MAAVTAAAVPAGAAPPPSNGFAACRTIGAQGPKTRDDGAVAVERSLGNVGTRVLFESDSVRIWEMHLDPGQESDVHRHELDYILVLIGGDRIAVAPEPDTEGRFREYMEVDVVPGAVVHVGRGGVETARNVGSQPYHEVIVELKDQKGTA